MDEEPSQSDGNIDPDFDIDTNSCGIVVSDASTARLSGSLSETIDSLIDALSKALKSIASQFPNVAVKQNTVFNNIEFQRNESDCSKDEGSVGSSISTLNNRFSDFLEILKILQQDGSLIRNSTIDTETGTDVALDGEAECYDDVASFNACDDDEESFGDDSDDESLCNKLCTYSATRKEFINQHWYHCYTCNMIDRVGVCSICARVCHKDHDVTYARFGAFFCDCAVKEDGSCLAMTKRPHNRCIQDDLPYQTLINAKPISSSDERENITESSDLVSIGNNQKESTSLEKIEDPHQCSYSLNKTNTDELIKIFQSSGLLNLILGLVKSLIEIYIEHAHEDSYLGRCLKVEACLDELMSKSKTLKMTEDLMLPTLGSQEGAFENVRVNFSGEYASTIRQLLSNHTLKRVSMTSLSSPFGKRQHLVVCHEKGKITLLQLNTLLKQADSSKKKLTLTRLACAPVPFSVISVVANAFNEDVLAVCGLKDCHILSFSPNGFVSSYIEINLNLPSSQDYIIKALWLPGSESELAILTSKFVKIYDLYVSSSEAKYSLSLVSTSIKDITFIVPESQSSKYLLIIDELGIIYRQILDKSLSNTPETYLVSTEIIINDPSMSIVDGCRNYGGVSIYYSHSLRLIFMSFLNGKNFIASFIEPYEISNIYELKISLYDKKDLKSHCNTINENADTVDDTISDDKSTNQPLCRWSDISDHVGLVIAFSVYTNNPVIIMLKPSSISVQEICHTSLKSRITDATTVRHTTSSGEIRTTLIILCEDGSLRIYMASPSTTDFWLERMPIISWPRGNKSSLAMLKIKQRRTWLKNFVKSKSSKSSVSFPVEFFENCEVMNSIEFGGSDVLSIYNTQQVKTRLNSPGMYIANRKSNGFSIDVINSSSDMVICGIRVELGCSELEKAPQFIEIFKRKISFSPKVSRWYDIPFTREESILGEKRFSIFFGPSKDSIHTTIVDSIKIYGRSKESFSWPDEFDDISDQQMCLVSNDDMISYNSNSFQYLSLQSMEVLKNILLLNIDSRLHEEALKMLSPLLCDSLLYVTYSRKAVRCVKDLLITLYPNRIAYNQQRDTAAINFVIQNLEKLKDSKYSAEIYARVVAILRNLCKSDISNLSKIGERFNNNEQNESSTRLNELVGYLSEKFWNLYSQKQSSPVLLSVASNAINFDETLSHLIEIIYTATTIEFSILDKATDIFREFLLTKDFNIALCARQTIIKLLKVKIIATTANSSETYSNNNKHHAAMLDKFIDQLKYLDNVGGYKSVSLLHIVLILFLDLRCDIDPERELLQKLMVALDRLLHIGDNAGDSINRNSNNELKLLIMRMLSIMMSKIKVSTNLEKSDTEPIPSNQVSLLIAKYLSNSGILDFCYDLLKQILPVWKEDEQFNISNQSLNISSLSATELILTIHRDTLLENSSYLLVPDLTPFFLRQFAKGTDPFDEFKPLITEMALRLPYQIKKLNYDNLHGSYSFDDWTTILCEYLLTSIPTTIKKHVRKFLTFICGSKEKYRQLRDFHSLHSHMSEISKICRESGAAKLFDDSNMTIDIESLKPLNLTYDTMTTLVEHFKACIEIGHNRCINWQMYCSTKNKELLNYLLKLSLCVEEDVASVILELIEHAIGDSQPAPKQVINLLLDETSCNSGVDLTQANQTLRDALTTKSLNAELTQQLIVPASKDFISRFIQQFLLETNQTSIRWQAHSLLSNMWLYLLPDQQLNLVLIFWSIWHKIPRYGRKAATFVDFIGFITLKSTHCGPEYEEMFCHEVLNILRQQNRMLMHHSNSHLYSSLQRLIDIDGYYLESETCSVCNSPEVEYSTLKLNSLKVDSKFSTTSHIIKLIGSYTILRFSLRILDVKRSKMVKTIHIRYNNKPVQSVVELKNKPGIWHSTRKYTLQPAQTDVKIDFTLPITACNLLIEFVDFYENLQAVNETLQCPRCSTTVSANPGVCSNCGENVFQCHKCRSINYDERDPFFCNSCGFCKYARFDISLIGRPTCEVDSLHTEEDRKKALTLISSLLEKADRLYKNLLQNKPILENLVSRVQDQMFIDKNNEELDVASSIDDTDQYESATISLQQSASIIVGSTLPSVLPTTSLSTVNKTIQNLAHKYSVDCKNLFEELARTTHKILATRKKLIEYDNNQLKRANFASNVISTADRRQSRVYLSLSTGSGKCYGCGNATVEHCVTMLKALVVIPRLRSKICDGRVIDSLINFNLQSGTTVVKHHIFRFFNQVTNDDPDSANLLCEVLIDRVTKIQNQHWHIFEISPSITNELALLSSSNESTDQCWEIKLKCLIKIFSISLTIQSSSVIDHITIPCLKMLLSIVNINSDTNIKGKTDKLFEEISSVRTDCYRSRVSLNEWLAETKPVFNEWRKRVGKPAVFRRSNQQKSSYPRKKKTRDNYLIEKYGNLWRINSSKFLKVSLIFTNDSDWIRDLLFHRSSKTIRILTKTLVEALFTVRERRQQIIDSLISYLDDLTNASDSAQEFFLLFKNVIQHDHWRYYSALKGLLLKIGNLLTCEIDDLQELEESTLSSSLSQGSVLKMLVDILATFLDDHLIRAAYKTKLIGFILKGYISLRRLVTQRTRMINEAQEQLLALLESMISGNEEETAAFMTVCVEAVRNCHESDIRTPIFIFERLCSTIHTDENGNSEFFVSIEKDPQQEDFLQGRMLGNPYSSNEFGIGPLMKDIKNRICQDCELLALLEDDSSMELIVSNKIISLELPLKEVYKRIWCVENCENDPMRIVYRMRGLLGDATEEFIEGFDIKNKEEIDEEEVFKMANVMRTCGGLDIMIRRLKQIDDLSPPFNLSLEVILKLFNYCVKVRNNRISLLETSKNTINILLETLKLTVKGNRQNITSECHDTSANDDTSTLEISVPNSQTLLIEATLSVLEPLLLEIAINSASISRQLDLKSCANEADLKFILDAIKTLNQNNQKIVDRLIKIVPMVTFGDEIKMKSIIDFFESSIDFNLLDNKNLTGSSKEIILDLFCSMIDSIIFCEHGNQFKDYIVQHGIVTKCIEYLNENSPSSNSSLMTNSDEWNKFTSKPALKFALKLLTGIAKNHPLTQLAISEYVTIIHNLEQVSSETHVGTLAENLLEVIKQHPSVEEKIRNLRQQTREEKKKLAMAVRARQLIKLGMKANDRGQVLASCKLLEQCQDLSDETGLVCNICREGYKFQPSKIMGIYTFTKRCLLDEYEMKPRKTYGFTTVTHFNTVHIECHMSAIKSARGRDEWDSAALQNANTRCNGLLPIWGPEVPETSFATNLIRHNAYTQDCTGCREITLETTLHDIRLQLLRFSQERSFSEDTGGGGPQSNLHLIPYMMNIALYHMNSNKTYSREYKKVLNYLDSGNTELLESCYDVESPYFWTTLASLVLPPSKWKQKRVALLQRLIICNHVRRVGIKPPAPISDSRIRTYSYYKSALIFFALIDSFQGIVFKDAASDDWNKEWTQNLAKYIRFNDQEVNDNIEVIFNMYQDVILPCQSVERFFEIMNLDEIGQPNEFLAKTLSINCL